MEMDKIEIKRMDKDYISELLGEFQHCAFTYIEDENDEYNIEAFISFGLAKKVMKKIDEKLLNEVYEELEKEEKEIRTKKERNKKKTF